jgi:hypothetical protein
MSDASPAPDPGIEAALAQAQRHYDAGRLLPALQTARQHDTDAVLEPARSEALRLRTLAAYRLGELDEAAGAALTLLDKFGGQAPTYPARSSVLAASVVAAAELARYEQALVHLQQMLSAAVRGSFDDYVRARGTAATCFALLGDPWAAQRLQSELLGLFQGLPSESALEATVRNNHAAICLLIARIACDASEVESCGEALDHAEASIQRSVEIAGMRGDDRVRALADIHASELALLRGNAAAALAPLQLALDKATAAGLSAQERGLRVVLAEACIAAGQPARGVQLASQVDAALNAGHELGLRIRCRVALQQGYAALGDAAQALAQGARARSLEQYRAYHQLRTQSRYLRTRLELEHLYRYQASASRGLSS